MIDQHRAPRVDAYGFIATFLESVVLVLYFFYQLAASSLITYELGFGSEAIASSNSSLFCYVNIGSSSSRDGLLMIYDLVHMGHDTSNAGCC